MRIKLRIGLGNRAMSEHAGYNKHRLSDAKTAMQFRRRSYGR